MIHHCLYALQAIFRGLDSIGLGFEYPGNASPDDFIIIYDKNSFHFFTSAAL